MGKDLVGKPGLKRPGLGQNSRLPERRRPRPHERGETWER